MQALNLLGVKKTKMFTTRPQCCLRRRLWHSEIFLGKFLWLLFSFCACSPQRKRQSSGSAASLRRCQTLSPRLFLLSRYFSQQRLIALTPPSPLSPTITRPRHNGQTHARSYRHRAEAALQRPQEQDKCFLARAHRWTHHSFPVGPSEVLSSNTRTAWRT